MNCKIISAEIGHLQRIAELHVNELKIGYLSKLGVSVLAQIYKCVLEQGILLVAINHNERITGFISFSTDTKKLMRTFAFSSIKIYLKLFLFYFKNPISIVKSLETLLAPFKSVNKKKRSQIIPVEELLSIAVDSRQQQKGTGTALITALERELVKKEIFTYKVIAGAELKSANDFYLKNGFVRIKKIYVHGCNASYVYIKKINVV